MSRPPDRRPCVCRGYVTPASDSDHDVTRAVADHGDTPEHHAWRYRELMAGTLSLAETPAESIRRHLGIVTPIVRPVTDLTDAELVPMARRHRPWDGEL